MWTLNHPQRVFWVLSNDCGIAEQEAEEIWFWKFEDQYGSHLCKDNPYSILICHNCRLSKTPSSSSFVPTNPNNTIPAKPKMTSEKIKTKKLQEEKKKTGSPQEMRHHWQWRFAGAKAPRDTKYWVAQRLHKEPTEWVIGILSNWSHLMQTQEATEETVTLLNNLSDKDVLWALRELKKPRCHIRRMSGWQLDIEVKVQMLNDARTFLLKALLDSWSTGSCVGRKFVNNNEIWTRKTVIPVLVHNADGTLNWNRSITDYVFLRLSVRDHMEQPEFAVADLETHDLFIGQEWLKLHNPNIDWKTSEIRFNRCPKECGYTEDLWDPEADEEEKPIELEPGDRLYAFRLGCIPMKDKHHDGASHQSSRRKKGENVRRNVTPTLPRILRGIQKERLQHPTQKTILGPHHQDDPRLQSIPPHRRWTEGTQRVLGREPSYEEN